MRHLRPRLRATLAAAVASLALVGGTLSLTSPVHSATLPTAAVALGDSFISGEGAGAYESVVDTAGVAQAFPGWTADNANAFFCHRSANASIKKAALPGIDARFNLACSGGQPHDMANASSARASGRNVASQISQLRQVAQTHDIDVVLIGLGSNNSQFTFGDVAAECAGRFVAAGYTGWWEFWVPLMNWISGTPVANENPCSAADMATAAEVATAKTETTNAVRQVLTALNEIDADGQHTVVLQSYTDPLPADFNSAYWTEDGRDDTRDKFRALVNERYVGGCPAHRASLAPAVQFTGSLADIVQTTWATLSAERPAENLVYLDVRQAMDGARLCEKTGSPTGTLATPLRLKDDPNGAFVTSLDGLDKLDLQRITKTCDTYFQTCQESWHPNAAGHAVLGQCLAAATTRTRAQVACRRLSDGTVSVS